MILCLAVIKLARVHLEYLEYTNRNTSAFTLADCLTDIRRTLYLRG
jgi:hypothetical protein